jgi:transcriptional regulator with XRE-family HTH domain
VSDPGCSLTDLVRQVIREEIAKLGLTKPVVTARTMRLLKGLSVEELAHRAGVSAALIGKYENGQVKNIGSKNPGGLARIAEALGKSTEEYVQAIINGGQRNG